MIVRGNPNIPNKLFNYICDHICNGCGQINIWVGFYSGLHFHNVKIKYWRYEESVIEDGGSQHEAYYIQSNMPKCIIYWISRTNMSLTPTHFSGLNPSTSSRNTLLWETESPPGIIRNFKIVPRVEPRNKTVRFLWGPASVSTTMVVSWYLDKEIVH